MYAALAPDQLKEAHVALADFWLVYLSFGAALMAILFISRFNTCPVRAGVIGEPDHEVIVEPEEEPVPKTTPVPAVAPEREIEPQTVG
jgi:hypothetical protein